MWTGDDFVRYFEEIEEQTGQSFGEQIKAIYDNRDFFLEKAKKLEKDNEELKVSLDHMIEAWEKLNKKYEKMLQERNVFEDMNESLKAEIRRLKSQLR